MPWHTHAKPNYPLSSNMKRFLASIFQKHDVKPPDRSFLIQLKSELDKAISDELHAWYPASIDKEHGGFYTDLNYKYEPDGPHRKTIVHQSRHLWTLSRAGLRFPENNLYKDCAEHGFRFISDHFWDRENGGFFTEADRTGTSITTEHPYISYGQSFALYGIIAYHSLTKSPEALKLAIDTFHWLDENMYDPECKGYYSFADRDRTIIDLPGYTGCLNRRCQKGVNSILHLLEAYTDLYNAWPDTLLFARLSELLEILEEKIIQPEGYLHNYFDRTWNPVRISNPSKSNVRRYLYLDHVSFGHDAEAAFLMQEAAAVLKERNLNKTIGITKKLVDHSINFGMDRRKGGLYGKGYYFSHKRKPVCMDKVKYWWVQAEMLYALLLMWSLHPDDDQNYFARFQLQWAYIKDYCLDHQNGGWFERGLDRSPKPEMQKKSHEWKATYHTYRALENCSLLIDKMVI
jgi:mannobiose 2-epimerase